MCAKLYPLVGSGVCPLGKFGCFSRTFDRFWFSFSVYEVEEIICVVLFVSAIECEIFSALTKESQQTGGQAGGQAGREAGR